MRHNPLTERKSSPLRHDATWGLGAGMLGGLAAGAQNVEALIHDFALGLNTNSIVATTHYNLDVILSSLNADPDLGAIALNAAIGSALVGIAGLLVGGAIGSVRSALKMALDKLNTSSTSAKM